MSATIVSTVALTEVLRGLAEPYELYLVAHPNRGRILSIESARDGDAEGGEPIAEFHATELSTSYVAMPSAVALPAAGVHAGPDTNLATQLRVTYLDDPPEFVRWVVHSIGSADYEIFVAHGEYCVDDARALVSIGVVNDVAQALVSPFKYGAALAARIARLPPSFKVAGIQAFAWLDQATNPTLLAVRPGTNPSIVDTVNAVQGVLTSLFRLRARLVSAGDPTASTDLLGPPSPALCECVATLSKLMAELSFTALPHPAFDDQFENFANGELRTELLPDFPAVWTTQPSSGNFFLFAEFAFLAVHCGVDARNWLRRANVMTRAQVLFMKSYAPSLQYPRFEDYTACNFRAPCPHSEKTRLRADYDGLPLSSLRWRSGRNSVLAFPGTFA